MTPIKTINATGAALDWLVWKCAGGIDAYPKTGSGPAFLKLWRGTSAKYVHPSTDWAQGGPIIEREGINLSVDYQDDALSNDMVQIGWKGNLWNNSVPGTSGFLQWAYGPTPLIAAMRCFVASRLGDTVEVPEELL